MRLVVADLLPETDYILQVRAVSPRGVSQFSPAFPITTIVDTTKPKVPSNSTWIVSADSFYGEWDVITQNLLDKASNISRYEVEIVGGSVTKIVAVPQTTDATQTRVGWTLTFEQNRALFGTPQPTVTFRVRAVDSKGLKSDWSALRTATNAAPSAPTGPPTGNVATAAVNSIEVSWTNGPDGDIAAYRVYVGTTAGFTPSTSNKIFDGLATKVTYATTTYSAHYFKIRAVDKFGQESVDLASNAATPSSPFTVDSTPPAVPTLTAGNVTVTSNSNGQGARASLSWSGGAETDRQGYELSFKRNADATWSSEVFGKDTTSAIVELPYAYTAYDFRIRAFDWSANYSAFSSTVSKSADTNSPPSNVAGLVSTPGRDAIRYDWAAISDADLKEYEVTFSTSPTFANNNTTFSTGASTLTVAGLIPATTYYARIRAVDRQGSTSSSWSSTDTETTLSASSTVSVSDLTGGTFGNIDMYLGPGADLIINGGNIHSNTYTGTDAASNPSGAGFYLGNDGLRIDSGIINAGALKTGTISGTNTITLSGPNAKIIGTGFELSGSGLTVTSGTIAAAALQITSTFANDVGSSMTTIDGGIIKTGSIVSQTNTVVNGVSVPVWSIPLNGAASFADLQVRGNMVVGKRNATTGADDDAGVTTLSSANYVPGATGYQFRSNGTADLIGIGASAIHGESIVAGTLTVSQLAGGETDEKIRLVGGASIYAEGLMGEYVSLSDEGFVAWGPHRAVVTHAEIIDSGGGVWRVRLFTTGKDSGFRPPQYTTNSEGDQVLVGNNTGTILVRGLTGAFAAYNGTQVVTNYSITPNAERVEFDIPVATAVAKTAMPAAEVFGRDTANVNQDRKQSIYFPADGAAPNIISGQLTSEQLTITKNATLGASTVNPIGAVLGLQAGIDKPTVPVTPTFITPSTNVGTVYYKSKGMTIGPNGDILVLQAISETTSAADMQVGRFSSNGDWLGEALPPTTTVPEYSGMHYYNNKLYIFRTSRSNTNTWSAWVDIYTVSGTTYTYLSGHKLTELTNPSGPFRFNGGWNYNNNRIVLAASLYASANTYKPVVYEWNLDANGIPTTQHGVVTTLPRAFPVENNLNPNFIMRANAGYGGGERYVVKPSVTANGVTSQFYFFYTITTSGTTTEDTQETFSTAANSGGFMYSGGNIYELIKSSTAAYSLLEHQGGETIVSGTANAKKWVAYSWANATKETTIGGAVHATQVTRKLMKVTIGEVPMDPAGNVTDYPTMAMVYMKNSGESALPTTGWVHRLTIPGGSTTGNLSLTNLSSNVPKTSNGFSGGTTPGKIAATNGGFWVDGSSNGAVGAGTLRNTIMDAVRSDVLGTQAYNLTVTKASQTIPSTSTRVNWNSRSTPDIGSIGFSNNELTVPTDGIYAVSAYLSMNNTQSSPSPYIGIELLVNDNNTVSVLTADSGSVIINVAASSRSLSWTGFLNAGAKVYLEAELNTSGNGTVTIGTGSRFRLTRIG